MLLRRKFDEGALDEAQAAQKYFTLCSSRGEDLLCGAVEARNLLPREGRGSFHPARMLRSDSVVEPASAVVLRDDLLLNRLDLTSLNANGGVRRPESRGTVRKYTGANEPVPR